MISSSGVPVTRQKFEYKGVALVSSIWICC
jgi:hypothetical protein